MFRKRSRQKNIGRLLKDVSESGFLDLDEQNTVNILRGLPDVEQAPELPQILYYCGMKASGAGLFELASSLYETAIELGLEHAEIYYNLGNARLSAGLNREAGRAYGHAIEIDPGFAFAYYNRGLSRLRRNDDEGIEDLIEAARLDCDFQPLYQALCRHAVAQHGYVTLFELLAEHRLPRKARSRLLEELETSLFSSHYLLTRTASASSSKIDDRLRLRCLLADASTATENAAMTPLKRLRLLLRVATEARRMQDRGAEWRALYLLGVMAYYPFISRFPPDLPVDIPEVFIPLGWSGAEMENAFHDVIDREAAELDPKRDERRVAAFARKCFERCANVLCEDQPMPRKRRTLEETQADWHICEDAFRELVRSCVYLKDPEGVIDGVEQARFRYHRTWAQTLPKGQARTCADKLKQHFGPVAPHRIRASLGEDGLMLGYYICEIVEDRLICGALYASSAVAFEDAITVQPRSGSPEDQSLMGGLLEANERWMAIEVRKTLLDRALGAFRKDQTRKSALLGLLLKAGHSNVPKDPDPVLEKLDRLLLGPVEQHMHRCRRLVVAPFSYLHNFPFHVLPSIQRLLDAGTLKALVYAPSLRHFANVKGESLDNNNGRRSCLFVGYDAQSGLSINQEKAFVERYFSHTKSLIGEAATRENVLRHLSEFDVVHFCCHGRFDVDRYVPYLELAGGRLFPQDLLSLTGRVPGLVFANTCISGSGPRTSRNGDQDMGVHTAFLISGAKNVIGTLWHVDDDVALRFAGQFYEKWATDPSTVTSEVFMNVQRSLKQDYDHLGMWAPHALFGPWD